ncbi:Ger(x)C family spore germination protein [Rossellomorea vietnamensis]|uniref:Ger(X)C family spore germination protein n=1 Tax=Rossellomorea vietnamensis TaxID=218284 RepID=A0A5D4MJN9_9BACI|nr:Ger(x)C family spore germination protein [Rossellomorea vietnamensis]TYS01504.1 Ger(x)C family spore germination protein [Rossellomorea vietnamensis]
MKKLPLIFSILLASTLLSSCVETRYLEKQGLITGVGYDVSEKESKIKGTIVFYQFNPSMKNLSTVISSDAETSKGIRMSANMETDHNLVSGQLRVALYGEEIAKAGINSLVDSLSRDASIGNMIFLAVASPTANEILSFQPKSQPTNMGTYLYNLMQLNIQNEVIPNPTLQEFMTSYGSVGKDPILPYLSIVKGKVGITGFALFSDDKQVGVLEREKIFYVRSLLNSLKTGTTEVEIPRDKFEKEIEQAEPQRNHKDEENTMEENFHITMDNIKNDYKINLVDKSIPSFDIKLELESRILEMTVPLNLSEAKVLRKLESELENSMREEGMKVIRELQETGSDPIGFGTHYRASSRGKEVTKKIWAEKYPEAEFNLNIELKIVRTGIID